MKHKFLKSGVIVAAIILVCWTYVVGLHAQQSSTTPPKSPATTNWIGYLVVGQNDTSDSIAIGPHPTVSCQVEIGLRSDGVLVWRKVSNSK
jgi:hypothetical protein